MYHRALKSERSVERDFHLVRRRLWRAVWIMAKTDYRKLLWQALLVSVRTLENGMADLPLGCNRVCFGGELESLLTEIQCALNDVLRSFAVALPTCALLPSICC